MVNYDEIVRCPKCRSENMDKVKKKKMKDREDVCHDTGYCDRHMFKED